MYLSFPKRQYLGLVQTDRVCRRQFHFDENGKEISKWVENTVGKGEIARQKTCTRKAETGSPVETEIVNGIN